MHTPNFPTLLRRSHSLLVTTYQAGKLVMLRYAATDSTPTSAASGANGPGLIRDRLAIGTTIQVLGDMSTSLP